MNPFKQFLVEHERQSRRYFLRAGFVGTAAWSFWPTSLTGAEQQAPELATALESLEQYFTAQSKFRDVSRGKPLPHSLPEEKKREVGLTRETWKLEVLSDPEHPADVRMPLSKAKGTALDFPGLLEIGQTHAVRFAKVMTCLNIGCPLGMGVWEGVPLREVVWRTQPRENLRRLFYYGYHNDDPKQMFRSSLPIGRVFEDPYDLPPVILCYKLNGDWLDSERGGPVRIVVPEAYGFKCIKWVSHVVLTNLFHANDTYGEQNNDVDSPLKTFAATLSVPKEAKAGQPVPVTGYAQVGISGLSKVQVWVQPDKEPWPGEDRHFLKAPWIDAQILSPPKHWGAVADGKVPPATHGFDSATGQPNTWPMRLAKVHWAVLLPGLPPGEYTLRSRTVDEKGHPQPLPRPFRKSGHSAIEAVTFKVLG